MYQPREKRPRTQGLTDYMVQESTEQIKRIEAENETWAAMIASRESEIDLLKKKIAAGEARVLVLRAFAESKQEPRASS